MRMCEMLFGLPAVYVGGVVAWPTFQSTTSTTCVGWPNCLACGGRFRCMFELEMNSSNQSAIFPILNSPPRSLLDAESISKTTLAHPRCSASIGHSLARTAEALRCIGLGEEMVLPKPSITQRSARIGPHLGQQTGLTAAPKCSTPANFTGPLSPELTLKSEKPDTITAMATGTESSEPREVSVVIPAAGSGSRLGRNSPKALLELAGRCLVEWQLALCRDVAQVVLVVGFRGDEVAELAAQTRPGITVVTNSEYSSTLTGASVTKGASAAHHERLIVLDGDVLVHPDDWLRVLECSVPFVGIGDAKSQDAVYVREDQNGTSVLGFSRVRDNASHEWVGVCGSVRSDWLNGCQGHIFQKLESSLPMDSLYLRTIEVDYPHDLALADQFAREFFKPVFDGS